MVSKAAEGIRGPICRVRICRKSTDYSLCRWRWPTSGARPGRTLTGAVGVEARGTTREFFESTHTGITARRRDRPANFGSARPDNLADVYVSSERTVSWQRQARVCSLRGCPANQAVLRAPGSPRILISFASQPVAQKRPLAGDQAARQSTGASSIRQRDWLPIGAWLLRIVRCLRCKDLPGQVWR